MDGREDRETADAVAMSSEALEETTPCEVVGGSFGH